MKIIFTIYAPAASGIAFLVSSTFFITAAAITYYKAGGFAHYGGPRPEQGSWLDPAYGPFGDRVPMQEQTKTPEELVIYLQKKADAEAAAAKAAAEAEALNSKVVEEKVVESLKSTGTSILPEVPKSDAAEPWQMLTQDPATDMMTGIISFHNFLLCLIIAIGISVGIVLFEALWKFNSTKNIIPSKFAHASSLEIAWTILPALVLLYLAGPSFSLLYALDEICSKSIVIKVIGHQWYWTYEIPNILRGNGVEYIAFDSYIQGPNDLRFGSLRLLEVDQQLLVPTSKHLSFLITSGDVLHSWAVPSFGVKLDACPGRLAHITMSFQREGVFYGQCSEICGTGHGFMPIVVRVVQPNDWATWAASGA
jgi:cytochrome c oxidase subunit II